MARHNYSFEKRQRHIAKQKKRQEKLERRTTRKPEDGSAETAATDEAPSAETQTDVLDPGAANAEPVEP